MVAQALNEHFRRVIKTAFIAISLSALQLISLGAAQAADLAPLVEKNRQVDWWFVFKFNMAVFPGCGSNAAPNTCAFGGEPSNKQVGQQFVYASSTDPALQKGKNCAGTTLADPLGATFDKVYNGDYYYVVWNDQFYNDPAIKGCKTSCGGPWGHSKGMLAWNDAGEGLVLQVTTPSWPASGSKNHPRLTDGNTLGCISNNNVKYSQHFFALRLDKGDVIEVLKALRNASVVTDPANPQIVRNGGPTEIQKLVKTLGVKSKSETATTVQLSTGVGLISKPSKLQVPPWQMVSALLGGVSLRSATWWDKPKIPSTNQSTAITCWSDSLRQPGAVEIATSGSWDGKRFGLEGGLSPIDHNHAKFGVTTSQSPHLSIFGDLNQQGTLSDDNCARSQNGRGGLFFVVENERLHKSISELIKGDAAPYAHEYFPASTDMQKLGAR